MSVLVCAIFSELSVNLVILLKKLCDNRVFEGVIIMILFLVTNCLVGSVGVCGETQQQLV